MKNDKLCQSIVDYWNAVERFTPYKLDAKNKLGYVQSIQEEVLGAHDIPWQSRKRFGHAQTPNKIWVYTVFLGVINYADITQLIKIMLGNEEEDYNLQVNDQISCLCAFQLNSAGEVLQETFTIPEYFISMACLNQRKEYPWTWLSLAPKTYQKIESVYKNWADVLKNRADNHGVGFEDLKELVDNIITASGINELRDCIRNNAVIYSSHIPIPNKSKYAKENPQEKFANLEYDEEPPTTVKVADLNIMGSFYLDDLKMVREAFNDKKSSMGKALKDYLGLHPKDKKYDLRKDKLQLEQLSRPKALPNSRWPGSNKIALSIAQQVAVNLALEEKEGVFSVNGPPGTGKSTLLRDIISEVITNRAKILADFTNPKDAFNDPTMVSIEGYNYKIWSLDPRLLGHEIVIASTNNTAVENISKEIPRSSEVDPYYGLDYFSEIASYVNNEPCWGIIA